MTNLKPPPAVSAELASRFVDVPGLPWEKTRFPGIEQKTLLIDKATGLLTALMKMGSLVCPEGECRAGQFVWRPAGSRHIAWAGPQGGLFLGIFQVPNKFFETDGRVTDALSNDWEASWGKAR
jgi:hypothetical protein